MNLDDEDVLREYTKFIYDVAIQISAGLDHAHFHKFYHGLLDTSKIMVHRIKTQKEKDEDERQERYRLLKIYNKQNPLNPKPYVEGEDEPKLIDPLYHFKITGFAPIQSMAEVFGSDQKSDP